MLRYLWLPMFLLFSTSSGAFGMCGDMDGSGTITVTDGVNVLRAAAGLPSEAHCDDVVPVPTSTPAQQPTAVQQPTAHATPIQTDALARLIGTWDFRFTIISSFTWTYRLQQVKTINGIRSLVGLDEFGDPVVAARIQELDPGSALPYEFSLLDPSPVLCLLYVFDQTSETVVSGVTYAMLTDSNGECDLTTVQGYALSGARTSTSANAAGAEAFGRSLDDAIVARDIAVIAQMEAADPVAPAGDLEDVRRAARAAIELMR